MPNISPKKLREIIASTYWTAHTDGRMCGRNGKPDFAIAGLTIEAAAIKAGCRPVRLKDVDDHPAFKPIKQRGRGAGRTRREREG